VVRFYTNPDGRAARRTTLVVLALLGLFYFLPPVYGALGRLYAPDLLAGGSPDTVVLELPARMVGGLGGELLSALTAAGAFAAFLSTSSGLTVAVAGVISQDVMRRRFRGVRAFQAGAVVAVAVPLLLAVTAEGVGVARAVGLAFAVAASTFCPLLVLGIWWRRLTDAGAIAGLLVGGALSGGAVVLTLVDSARAGWPGTLISQPAAWSVPTAFVTMVLVSLLTQGRLPLHVSRTMVRLHTPEAVELDRGPQPH
jgi:cation/acetate symporter